MLNYNCSIKRNCKLQNQKFPLIIHLQIKMIPIPIKKYRYFNELKEIYPLF